MTRNVILNLIQDPAKHKQPPKGLRFFNSRVNIGCNLLERETDGNRNAISFFFKHPEEACTSMISKPALNGNAARATG